MTHLKNKMADLLRNNLEVFFLSNLVDEDEDLTSDESEVYFFQMEKGYIRELKKEAKPIEYSVKLRE